MTNEHQKKGNPYDQIPPEPRNDLAKFLYQTYLRKVVPGLNRASEAIGKFAVNQSPEAARKFHSTVGNLYRVSAQAAQGQLGQINFKFPSFSDHEGAETFAEIISHPDSELFPVPSSITHRLHDPHLCALDGMARRSLVAGLSTVVTEVSNPRTGRTEFTVRWVGYARLIQEEAGT